MNKTTILQEFLSSLGKNLKMEEGNLRDLDIIKKSTTEKISVRENLDKLHVGENSIQDDGIYFITYKGLVICQFFLTNMFHCCGIAVLHGVNVGLGYRKRGIFKSVIEFSKKLSNHDGYTLLLCTSREATAASKEITTGNWKVIHTFNNRRTHNDVNISIFKL